jgi:hypothetical protein
VGIEITPNVYYGRASVGGKGLTEKAELLPRVHTPWEKMVNLEERLRVAHLSPLRNMALG